MADGLREEGEGVDVDFGMIDVKDEDIAQKDEYLAVMDAVTSHRKGVGDRGKPLGIVGPSLERSFDRLLEERSYAAGGTGSKAWLKELGMRWVHAEPVIESDMDVSRKEIRKKKDLLGIKQYPPKFSSKKISQWASKHGYNRAYVVIAEVDRFFPYENRIYLSENWDDWIDDTASGRAILSNYRGKPPRDVGDVLEIFAAYSSGRAFDMEKVKVLPFDLSQLEKKKVPANLKYRKWANVLGKTKVGDIEYPVYRNYIGFLVVGRGPYKPMGYTREAPSEKEDIKLPDL